ncbi:MAG: phosphoglyceromutase [Proteobacteria bacterium]|nr:phosphoglyceromutase [Pseudomonadota bacterium]
MKSHRPKPIVLLIFDGFGYSEEADYNAIGMASTPHWDRRWSTCPHTLLDCSGASVGLPDGQMGNSEVGHLHLGAGRLVAQDFTRINMAVADRSFFQNPVLCEAVDKAVANGKALHALGLLSPGGVHSHEAHIQAMVELAVGRGLRRVFIHCFLDGRDMPPKSAAESIRSMENRLSQLGAGRIASLVGRFYAMDRDNRWERVSKAYDLIARGKPEFVADGAMAGLEMAYGRGETDAFVCATAVVPPAGAPVRMEHGDVVVFMNFRADRARELTRCLNESEFSGFERGYVPQLGSYITLTEFHEDFRYPIAYPPESVTDGHGEVLGKRGLHQLRLAETEKYAHVTFFLNGGVDTPFPGESRILVPSPKVKTYDMQPEMSAPEVTDQLVTADHGIVEQMVDPRTGEVQTAHTVNPVPFVYLGAAGKLADGGNLADVAPTLLSILQIEQPAKMTGRSLLI